MAMSHRDRLLAVAVVNPALHRLHVRDTLSSIHDGPLLGLQLRCTVYTARGVCYTYCRLTVQHGVVQHSKQ